MPHWFYNSPPEDAPASEQRTAELWQNLGDGFSIRWGFSYRGEGGVWREGDFVVQGPDGHILVAEAKSGEPARNPSTGLWNTASGENPFTQLDQEWNGVLSQLQKTADSLGIAMPFISSALALPDVTLAPPPGDYAGHPRERVLDRNDLGDLAAWWKRVFVHHRLHPTLADARRLFEQVFLGGGKAATGTAKHTLDFADRIIERLTQYRFDVLDALSDHEQLVFQGGPGTGKTWVALEIAHRWAKAGRRVLFLCYNLALEGWLKAVCLKLSENIVVTSFGDLGEDLLKRPHPTDFVNRDAKSRYYDTELPEAMARVLADPGFQPRYDALIVDEAQDHNTHPRLGVDLSGPGWWAMYFRMLREGATAPVAIFHDTAQRLVLRGGGFDPRLLRDALLAPVSVRLNYPMRYTRPLVRYFGTLRCQYTEALLTNMKLGVAPLPPGPEPELLTGVSQASEAAVVAGIVKRWLKEELARIGEILVLYASSFQVPDWVEQGRAHGVNFHQGLDGCRVDAVTAVSINQAKGLERRAVIVVGLPDWTESIGNEYKALTHVQGVTRAQHLLAVVTRPKAG